MFDRIFKDIFGAEAFEKLENAFEETMKEFEDSDEKNDGFSYFHNVSDKYENGKHVSHDEKEVKNGEVLKDIHRTPEICDIKNHNCGNTACDCKNDNYRKNQRLEQHLKSAENALQEKDEKISKLEAENNELRNKLEHIKSLF